MILFNECYPVNTIPVFNERQKYKICKNKKAKKRNKY